MGAWMRCSQAVDDQFPYKKVGLFLPVISRGITSRHKGEIIPLTHLQSKIMVVITSLLTRRGITSSLTRRAHFVLVVVKEIKFHDRLPGCKSEWLDLLKGQKIGNASLAKGHGHLGGTNCPLNHACWKNNSYFVSLSWFTTTNQIITWGKDNGIASSEMIKKSFQHTSCNWSNFVDH